MPSTIHHSHRNAARGLVAVEMALVAPILIILMFGIIEFGMMYHTQMQLNNMVREAARTAAVGGQPADVLARLRSAGSLDPANLAVTMQYRVYLGSDTWGPWQTLAAGAYNNTAPSGSEIRLTGTYVYHLTVGALFASLVDNPAQRTHTLRCVVCMRRE